MKLNDAAHEFDGEGEDEVEIVEEEEEEEDMDAYDEVGSVSASEDEGWYTPQAVITPAAAPPPVISRPKKRSSDEVDRDHPHDGTPLFLRGNVDWKIGLRGGGTTPPKRARRGEVEVFTCPEPVVLRSPPSSQTKKGELSSPFSGRMRKRSSEELDDTGDESNNKRIKMSPGATCSVEEREESTESPPPSSSVTELSRPSSASLPL